MCPHQTAEEWQEIKDRPDEFAAAVRIEKEINEAEAEPEIDGRLFLYSGRVPLEMADFKIEAAILAPSKPCETGHCWT